MSELKEFNSERIYWAVEQVEREAGDIADLHLDDNSFYLKSEADKVIAELEEKFKVQALNAEEGWKEFKAYHISYAEAVKELYEKNKQLRHYKYKWCLAMAKLCNEKWLVHNFAEITTKLGFYDKWEKRWLELAEKFKEAK